jgi:tRNA (guanine37-N1)-methyltransferase
MRIDVVTLFPEFFETPLKQGLVGKAIESGAAAIGFIDPRSFTTDRHRTVDDTPYGGGGGMVMKPEPAVAAIQEAKTRGQGPVLLMTPQGKPISQRDLARWSKEQHLILLSGRYEGFDERIRAYVDEEVSLGDFVLTGGEYAALAIADGVIRLLPGTLGNAASPEADSFSNGLLEHPQYTRPPEFEGRLVPDVLLSGDHAKIAAWRVSESIDRTRSRRPDLLIERPLSALERRAMLERSKAMRPIVQLAILEKGLGGIGRIAAAYGVNAVHVFVDRQALARHLEARPGLIVVAASAEPLEGAPAIGPGKLREKALAEARPILLVLGSALIEHRGKHAHVPPWIGAVLPILRAGTAENDLPLEAALAVLLDRILGER